MVGRSFGVGYVGSSCEGEVDWEREIWLVLLSF